MLLPSDGAYELCAGQRYYLLYRLFLHWLNLFCDSCQFWQIVPQHCTEKVKLKKKRITLDQLPQTKENQLHKIASINHIGTPWKL